MTAILEFFALGTLGFWLLLTVVSIAFIACVENDHYTFPTIVALILAIVYWKPISNFSISWKAFAIALVAYVVIGVVWSIFRWVRYVKEETDEYKKDPTEYTLSSLKNNLKVTNNKSRITGWIAYWPWSLLWNITGDFFKMLSENLQGVYQKIADRALAGVPPVAEKKK